MAALVEMHYDALGLDLHQAGGLDEFTEQLLRGRFVEAAQSLRQPTVATIGHHGQGEVHIHVESHFAGQTVKVEEVDADPQTVPDPVALGITDDQLPGGFGEVVQAKNRK